MDMKEAVSVAKEYLGDLYEDEQITDVGLEEVVYEEESDIWKITIGFSRPWERNGALVTKLGERHTARSYKVVTIDDTIEEVVSLTDRVLKASE